MGREYFAVNQVTKRAYQLGKGNWELLAPNHKIDSSDVNKLRDGVLQVFGDPTALWTAATRENRPYRERIVQRLVELGKDLELRHDAEWDMFDEEPLPWKVIGSRYED